MGRALALEDATLELRVLGQPRFAYGYCLSCADELDAARAEFSELRRRAAEQGDESALPSLLNHLALIECLAGRLDLSAGLADESYVLALEGGHVPTQASSLAKRAMVAARQGEIDVARETAERSLALAGEDAVFRGGETAIWTLGFLELSVGNPDAAHRRLGPLVDAVLAAGIQEPGEIRCLPDEIEALVELGRVEEAEALLGRLEGWAERLGRPSALGAAGRCRGLLLEGPAALAALEHAASHDEPPFEHARTLLALGAAQRRARRRRAARETLEAACASFDALGAALWAAKARRELGRIGGRPPSSGELTPAERRVAELVAEGRTNQEVAAALVLSVHTVESALTQAYRKLGVRSRTELARRFAERV
jgi:DNA-binding CsgD family transcriptional regulator